MEPRIRGKLVKYLVRDQDPTHSIYLVHTPYIYDFRYTGLSRTKSDHVNLPGYPSPFFPLFLYFPPSTFFFQKIFSFPSTLLFYPSPFLPLNILFLYTIHILYSYILFLYVYPYTFFLHLRACFAASASCCASRYF